MSYSITPALIPHTEFHKGSWLLPVNGADWYYFMRRKSKHHIFNKKFISTVDKPLKKLVSFLQHEHITTLPSCSGHHFGKHSFEKIYDDLVEDMHKIRNGGLELRDVETGKIHVFHDEHYKLPWDKETFLKKVNDYQHEGIIGIETRGKKSLKEKLLHIRVRGARIIQKGTKIFIIAGKQLHGYNSALWNRITRKVKEAFKPARLA